MFHRSLPAPGLGLLAVLSISGCARDPVSSLPGDADRAGTRPAVGIESAPPGAIDRVPSALPDFTVGTVWVYEVTNRSRVRPLDGSEPWGAWTTRRIVREARAVEERQLDGRTYVVIQEFDRPVAPPGPMKVGAKVPHRRDPSGLYHRPPAVVVGTAGASTEEVRRGGPVGTDALLLPNPSRPGATFESNHDLHDRWIVQRHEPVRTGIGTVAAVHTRMIAGFSLRQGDQIAAWYTPAGRVASHRNLVRVAFDPGEGHLWVEVDTREALREIRLP